MNSQVLALAVNSQSRELPENYYDDMTNPYDGITPSDSIKTSINKIEPNYIALNFNRPFIVKTKEKQVGWWVGRIEKVYDDYFTAVLEDLQGRISISEFDLDEITPSELSLIAPDVRLTYTVTQVDKYSGREYISKISINGPPVWTETDTKKFNETYSQIFPEELFEF